MFNLVKTFFRLHVSLTFMSFPLLISCVNRAVSASNQPTHSSTIRVHTTGRNAREIFVFDSKMQSHAIDKQVPFKIATIETDQASVELEISTTDESMDKCIVFPERFKNNVDIKDDKAYLKINKVPSQWVLVVNNDSLHPLLVNVVAKQRKLAKGTFTMPVGITSINEQSVLVPGGTESIFLPEGSIVVAENSLPISLKNISGPGVIISKGHLFQYSDSLAKGVMVHQSSIITISENGLELPLQSSLQQAIVIGVKRDGVSLNRNTSVTGSIISGDENSVVFSGNNNLMATNIVLSGRGSVFTFKTDTGSSASINQTDILPVANTTPSALITLNGNTISGDANFEVRNIFAPIPVYRLINADVKAPPSISRPTVNLSLWNITLENHWKNSFLHAENVWLNLRLHQVSAFGKNAMHNWFERSGSVSVGILPQ